MIDTMLAGRYRIGSQLGEGGMAVVYKAMDVVLHRIVAIKVLRAQYAGDEEFVERFRREAQAAASLSHPNVVNIFDVGQAEDVHYIVYEYVQGQNLKQVLREEGRLDPRRAARIASAVARALQAAHERGLVHRDIKPHNILITPEGRVKVTDFGIARASSSATLTETGMVIGSVHYFSPEQARGHMVGPAADLYSLGVVLYEMLTGNVPFRGESPVAVALKHLQEEAPSPREWVKTIPRWLDDVVLKALAKDPARRYRSAAQMAVDLAWRNAPQVPSAEADGRGSERGTGPAPSVTAMDRGVDAGHAQRPGPANNGAEPRGFDPTDRPPPVLREDALDELSEARRIAAATQEDGDPSRPPRRGRGWLITLLIMLALGAGVYAATPLLLDVIFPPEVDVPDLAGLTYEEARPLAQAAGLFLRVEAEVYDRHIPEEAIVRQVPEAGRTVRKGREVALFLSLGPELGELPDVTGRLVRDARVFLTQAGFTLASEEGVPDADAPVNEVVAQEPAPGTVLEKGSPVTLWVSKPGAVVVERVDVPDFIGTDLSDAEERLGDLGLGLGNTWAERHPFVPAGRVIDQNPPGGTTVDAGALIDFVYSEGLGGSSLSGTGPASSPSDGKSEKTPPDEFVAELPPSPSEGEPDFQIGGFAERPFPEVPFPEAEGPSEEMTPPLDGEEVDWDAVLRAEAGEGGRRRARVDVYIPPGAAREVVVLVIDDFGVREAFRETVAGDTRIEELVDGRGDNARLQVYVDGIMQTDEPFPVM